MRSFVTSAQKYLLEQEGKAKYPRIYLFCMLSGVTTFPPSNEFNPRLSAEYFQPALRYLFPNPRTIVDVLGDGTANCGHGLLLRQTVEKAAVPLGLSSQLGGSFAVKKFRAALREMAVAPSKSSAKNYMVNFDKAMAAGLELWRFSDSLRGSREKIALGIVQKVGPVQTCGALQKCRCSLYIRSNISCARFVLLLKSIICLIHRVQ